MKDVRFTIASWIREHGKQVGGANFCIYHKGPVDVKSPKDYVTAVCFPIK